MKSKFISILLFAMALNGYSQSIENLKTATKKLYEANYLMDFEAIVSYSYPKMVETIGAIKMLESVEKHYENTEFRLRFQLQTVPFQYREIKKIEGKSFCVITCRNPIRYLFESKLTAETAAEKAIWIKERNKTKEVLFEPKRNSFNVTKTTTFVAIMDETTSNEWKFFNFDDINQLASFQTFFGESIKKELGL